MEDRKHLSSIANDVLRQCSRKVGMSVDELVGEFERGWKVEENDNKKSSSMNYSRKLVEYCSSKSLIGMCSGNIEEAITDGSFSRFTFDVMLAWETPPQEDNFHHQQSSSDHNHNHNHTECEAKEKEDKKAPTKLTQNQDDIPLFYSDIMPLLVDNEANVGENAFVWLGSLIPLVADAVNGRFTFETLTASTEYRLHFPAYDKFLKEILNCIKHLQKQAIPRGVELVDDEFILHVEGTATSQRVIRHIEETSWPGRLTLTNYALYFEASGVVSYDDAVKIDLSKDIELSVKPAATGPWGAPLFDKAIVIDSPEHQNGFILEFPEITSSTRRDHWLTLVKEVMLLHKFLSKFKVESPLQAWEVHSRIILGIIRLHAAREMLRICPPEPKSFLIFALFDELPNGDIVLQELAESLKTTSSGHPCSASSILRNLNVSQPVALSSTQEKEGIKEAEIISYQPENLSLLETAVERVREEAKEINKAKATAEELKEEGIGDSALILMELLKPVRDMLPWFEEVIKWKRPATTITVISTILLVVYKEWVGKAIAAFLLWLVAKMCRARRYEVGKRTKIVVCTVSDQTTMESIVSAQHGLNKVYSILWQTNISILKVWSIVLGNAPKHTDMAIMVMTGCAILLAVVPLKFIIMALVLWQFIMTSELGNRMNSDKGNKQLNGWWDSIPVLPVEVLDKLPDAPKEVR